MSSIRYINQSAPFWDFVANLENQAREAQPAQATGEAAETSDQEQTWGWGPWGHHGPRGHWQHGHRGGRGGMPHHHRRGPPDNAQPPTDGEDSPPPPFEEKDGSPATEKGEPSNDQARDGPHREGRPHCAGRRKHCGGPGSRRGGPHNFGRGPWGGRGGGFPFGGFGGLAGAFFNENMNRETGDEDFKPEADVFDTEDAYVIHISLPGAKKDDVGVSWDAEKSELSVAGVVYRPGDEELLQTLALDERKVGAFDRKVRLGSRANPAQVDIDHISAKLEEGILRIEVPKLDKDYVEVKKVDIE
jgi:HSP20 family protein